MEIFASISTQHSVHVKENYNEVTMILEKVNNQNINAWFVET